MSKSSISTDQLRKSRVLIIDDEPMVVDWLRMVIEQAPGEPGFEVRAANLGSRGEELFQGWRPDVVLVDCCCPTPTALRSSVA